LPTPTLTITIGEPSDDDPWTYEVLIDNVACTLTP